MSRASALTMERVKSSNIDAIGHDARSNELHVRFTSGATYVYQDVHRLYYQKMLEAPSAGSYHADHIKGVFKHRKL